jgi:hypothetical protein
LEAAVLSAPPWDQPLEGLEQQVEIRLIMLLKLNFHEFSKLSGTLTMHETWTSRQICIEPPGIQSAHIIFETIDC